MNSSQKYSLSPIIPQVGTSSNPIDILDDEQQNKYYQQLVEQQRNSIILKQAVINRTSFDLVFSVAMSKINGHRNHKQHAVKNQIINYFYQHCHINIQTQYFHPRIQPQYDQHTTTLTHNIIIYGVDFRNTQQVIQMFTTPHHPRHLTIKKINWINDSHVQLTFSSQDIAIEIITRTSSETQGYRIKAEQEDNQIPRGWFELNFYEIYRIRRKVFARFATSNQGEIKLPKTVSRHRIFENAAHTSLQLFLLTKFSARQEYNEMLRKIEHEENNKKVLSKYKHHPIHKRIHSHKYSQTTNASDKRFEQYMERGRKLREIEKRSNLNMSIIHKANPSNRKVIDIDQDDQVSFQLRCDGDQQPIHPKCNWSLVRREELNDVDQQQIHPNLDWSLVGGNDQNIESNQHILQDINMLQIMQHNQLQKKPNFMMSQHSEAQHSERSSTQQKINLINHFQNLQLDNLEVESSRENISLLGRNIEQCLSFRQQQSIDEEYSD